MNFDGPIHWLSVIAILNLNDAGSDSAASADVNGQLRKGFSMRVFLFGEKMCARVEELMKVRIAQNLALYDLACPILRLQLTRSRDLLDSYIDVTKHFHRSTQICDHHGVSVTDSVKPKRAQETIEVAGMTERARLVRFEQFAHRFDVGEAIYVLSEALDRFCNLDQPFCRRRFVRCELFGLSTELFHDPDLTGGRLAFEDFQKSVWALGVPDLLEN